MIVANLLLALLLLWPTPTEHRVTFYWPGEDNWGNLVADPAIVNPGPETWDMRWCAVNDVDAYPFGTLLWVEDLGLYAVHDHCPQPGTVDIRVPKPRMECFKARVWVIFKPRSDGR